MASVWKNLGTPETTGATSVVPTAEIVDDDSCDICCGEDGACDVYFKPCGHKACASCVQKLRIANIYKADRGVRCPFCRQVIESYLDAPPPHQPVKSPFPQSVSFRLLIGGNLEAGPKGVAAIGQPYGRGGIVSIGGGNDYIPPKGVTGSDGGGLRSSTRMDELLPGYIVPPLKDTDDIVSMALDRTGARHLDFMLREGYPKRHKVAKLCREMLTPYVAKLAVHPSGNYVLQRMLEYAGFHRGEGSNSESFFTAIVRSVAKDKGLVRAAQDHRGTFSVQKMLVNLKGVEEATLVAHCIRGSVVMLALDQYGVYVLERLAEALITSLSAAPGKKPRVLPKVAAKILAQFCEEMHADAKALTSIAKHQVSGIMLVECTRWALPQSEAMGAALALANISSELVGSKLAHRTLQGILSLEVKEVAEHVIHGLRGRYVELATDMLGCGFKLVRACLATPCVGEGMRLLIVDELLYAVLHPAGHMSFLEIPSGCNTLAFGLCLLTRRVLDERLDTLVMVLEREKFLSFQESIEKMRKLFFIGVPPSDTLQGVSVTQNPPVSSAVHHHLSHSSSSKTPLENVFGLAQPLHGPLASDPWSEETASLAVSSINLAMEESLTGRGSQLRPSARGTHSHLSIPLEPSLAGEAKLPSAERHSTSTTGSTGGATTDAVGPTVTPTSIAGVASTTYTPPHLRGIATPALPFKMSYVAQSGFPSPSTVFASSATGSQSPDSVPLLPLPGRYVGRPGSYAPPHLRHSTASAPPTGFMDYRYKKGANEGHANVHLSMDPEEDNVGKGGQILTGEHVPTAGKLNKVQLCSSDAVDGQGVGERKGGQEGDGHEVSKLSGGLRQPGICAVCKRDSANTVLLDCSHMCCCTVCSRSISVCPICGNWVTGVIDIRPVGLPPCPSSTLPPQLHGSPTSLKEAAVATNLVAACTVSTNSLDNYGAVAQAKDGSSHPPAPIRQFQGADLANDNNLSSLRVPHVIQVGGRVPYSLQQKPPVQPQGSSHQGQQQPRPSLQPLDPP